VVVTAPSLVYSQRLADVFEWLFLPAYHASIIPLGMQVIAVLCIAIVLAYWLKNSIETPVVKNMIIVVMCACVLPPLVFFTLYFCIVHSVYHTVLVQKTMQMNFKSLAVATLIPMLGTVAIFSVAYWYFIETEALSVYYPLIFIGLFAVTCPHVLLTHLCNHNS
jgi:Brp/Blh family beta-carotene 15,15'-monooxygenase